MIAPVLVVRLTPVPPDAFAVVLPKFSAPLDVFTLMPIPVGTEIYRITPGNEDFIARYDGQVWLRPAEGS